MSKDILIRLIRLIRLNEQSKQSDAVLIQELDKVINEIKKEIQS